MRITSTKMQAVSFVFFALASFALIDIGQIIAGAGLFTLGLLYCVRKSD